MLIHKAVFFDRDGVINKEIIRSGVVDSPLSPEEFEVYPEIIEAIRLCRHYGYKVVVVSNQPRVARGTLSREMLDKIHHKMGAVLAEAGVSLDAVYVCPHDNSDGCNCRKPKPGMLLAAAVALNIDLKQSYMLGDRRQDIQAGSAAGCKTILLKKNYNVGIAAEFTIDKLQEIEQLLPVDGGL